MNSDAPDDPKAANRFDLQTARSSLARMASNEVAPIADLWPLAVEAIRLFAEQADAKTVRDSIRKAEEQRDEVFLPMTPNEPLEEGWVALALLRIKQLLILESHHSWPPSPERDQIISQFEPRTLESIRSFLESHQRSLRRR